MRLEDFREKSVVAGTKAVLRAVENGKAALVCIAGDCDDHVAKPLLKACEQAGVETERAHTRKELGKACKLQVGTAAVAVLK